MGTIFPTPFAHFVCLGPRLVILAILQTFSLLWRSVILGVSIAKAQVTEGSQDGERFLPVKCFSLWYPHCFFRHNGTAYLTGYSPA